MGGIVWSRNTEQQGLPERLIEPVDAQNNQNDETERKRILQDDMRRFKDEIAQKRQARSDAIKALNRRIADLQNERDKEKEDNVKLKGELDKMKRDFETNRTVGDVDEINKEIDERKSTTVRLDNDESQESSEVINERYEESVDKDDVIRGLEQQVKALKEVAMIGSEMLKIRELQVNELRDKLLAIEETGAAYEKEVENMKKLKNLYEERARAMTISHQMELEREKTKLLAAETRQKIAEHRNLELEEKTKELEENLKKMDGELDETKNQISELKIKLAGKNEDLYNATSQMAVVNQLFGRLFSPRQDSLEKITKVLEEHHDLVNHLTANGKINELASTLVEIADKDPLPSNDEMSGDISEHLSKVWRLLVELLGHHVVKPTHEEAAPESCYKSVETPSGPKLVISVSQTFLRLKDLILEKNSLMKEVGRLKDLNSTLDTRLLEQESRLSVVTAELHSTWSVVNKLKKQHRNLHTNEQVLRYELAQKRLLLKELKKKLEECKDNWSLAREKNSQTEKDWKLLRMEFASRKQQASSAESGYEESPTDSQDEEDNWKEDKTEEPSSQSEDNKYSCTVLPWDDSQEPKMERRGTLTEPDTTDVENVQNKIALSFRTTETTDHCAVLPWVESEDTSPTEKSLTTDPVTSKYPLEPSSLVQPSTSQMPRQRTAEEVMQARQDRLRRLEEGCKGLFNKVVLTNQRSDMINNRLTELHEIYCDDSRIRRLHDGTSNSNTGEVTDTLIPPSSSHNESSSSIIAEASPPPPPPLPDYPLYLSPPDSARE